MRRFGQIKDAAAFPAGGGVRACPSSPPMSLSPHDFEKLGQFYLGQTLRPDAPDAAGDLLLYDSKDLVTHGVVLGMTGSGKTGLCLAMLEEAALDDIPVLVIDPKGDIANLLLTFPELDAASFRPWINEDDAARKGRTPDQHAEETAAIWRSGLEASGQSGGRIRALREKCDMNVFTPGSRAGIPVSILGSLAAPAAEVMEDGELLGERLAGTVSALLSLAGLSPDSLQHPSAVLLSLIFQSAWSAGRDLNLEILIGEIQRPPFDKVGVIDLEAFLPAKSRQELALRFNNLLASPSFPVWLEGPSLDIRKLLHSPAGLPRISIFSIAHLSDSERMFFTTLLLNQLVAWMREQRGTTSLRAMFYMDEIFGYLPPTANPPSKQPMLTLLKQGRAFGLGCLLATQNPVDLDYKALSNIGTWFLGRLQTERDKLRVLDGLEGAIAAQGGGFDRKEMDRLLSGLGNRVFLMNNVHDAGPVLFKVRWAMSYLAGPLARGQIKQLMDPKRAAFATPAAAKPPLGMPGRVPTQSSRPTPGPGIEEFFAPVTASGPAAPVIYQPYLLRTGKVHFAHTRAGIEGTRELRLANPILAAGVDWEATLALDEAPAASPAEDAEYGELPGFAMAGASYQQASRDFAEWLYRNERAGVFQAPALKMYSAFGESEADFRVRLTHAAHEARDAEVGKLRKLAATKIARLESRLQAAEARVAKEKAEAGAAKMQAGVSVLGGFLGAILGRKSGIGSISRGSTAIGRASSAYKQHQDVGNARARVEDVLAEISRMHAELESELEEIANRHQPAAIQLESVILKPTRADVRVGPVGLLWLPVAG